MLSGNGDDGRRNKNDHQKVFELLEKHGGGRFFFAFVQLVWAVFAQTVFGLRGAEALRRGGKALQRLLRSLGKERFCHALSS